MSSSTSATPKAILFLGATGGCALSALKRSLVAGHECVALVRTPSKLTALLPFPSYPNLRVEQGNALDQDAVSRALLVPSGGAAGANRLVDVVVSGIGGAFVVSKMSNDDNTVCEKAMTALLAAISSVTATTSTGKPVRVIAVSSVGTSKFGRDVAIPMKPVYSLLIVPQLKDKVKMENQLYETAPGSVDWTVVRATHLVDDKEEKSKKPIRVGCEDPKAGVVGERVIGYTISREDVGKFIFESLIQDAGEAARFAGKIAIVTW